MALIWMCEYREQAAELGLVIMSGVGMYSEEEIQFWSIVKSFPPNKVINENEASWILGLCVSKLQQWRSREGGPPYIKYIDKKIGVEHKRASVRYILGDLIAWRDSHRVGDVEEAEELGDFKKGRRLARQSSRKL